LYQSDLPIVKNLAAAKECAWLNPNLADARSALAKLPVSEADVEDARARLLRFAPFISRRFPETKEAGGLIESPLREIPAMREALRAGIRGRLFAKLDCDLPIAGSIKARGGIYEVFKHAETLALENGLLREGEDYSVLDTDEARAFFSRYAVQVGSTGNLGLSIGIMSAAVGFRVTVHMSADAKQWKKDLLRSKGVNVVEYGGDYSAAVAEGRRRSDADPVSYFIDDENSKDLFMGYAVAAKRLDGQLKAAGIPVDAAHPLFVYIPCGVGGGPGGIAFGLKLLYGNNVHVFFVEPVQAPCMLLGMATGRNSEIAVTDIGLTGKTHADGLAVGRPSGFVGRVMEGLLSGEFTVADARLYDDLRLFEASEGLFAEPSACAAFAGPKGLFAYPEGEAYLEKHGLAPHMDDAVHIAWLTGGSLVPEEARQAYRGTRL
jgi:D-serine dehydratase